VSDVWSRAGAIAGRGFHYQDAVGAWLCALLLDGTETVRALIAATWKLRAARGYLAGQLTWRTALLGDLEGGWGGSATWTYDGSDDDAAT
jgi:hypothetical protein